ncbi:programmed cell death protein 2-like isoform X2 [Ambystoma mexicanum]|uniref:programmed cell death protein 2-like isoform X2 n=1 Tax=Ambystoma mexicanum TaxID=8296 RepID=UPI0037E833A4
MQALAFMRPVHGIQTKLEDYRWKVLRSQYLEARVEEKQDCSVLQEVLSARDWCEEADDWGMDDTVEPQRDAHPDQLKPNALTVSPSTKEPDCTVQMQSLSLADRGQGLVIPNSPPVFQSHHISVVDEEDYAGYVDVDHAQKLLNDYQQREGVDVEELISAGFAAKGEQEKYEKSATKSRDRVFHQFMKRISLCHEQILRYSWKGQPLFITSPPSSLPDLVPKCGACGSGRVFEFQLMPALVSMLASVDKGVSVEFGTALVYTCEKSCWSSDQSSPVEEFIFIQEDPDQSFFR